MAHVFFIGKKKEFKVVGLWSAKGGVGKTTLAVSLAYELAKTNSVGLLDADITNPNISSYLDFREDVLATKEGTLYPPIKDGIKVVSLGLMTDKAITWRGPLLSKAVEELLYKVKWNVEYLIVDMPPSTSDVQMTLAKELDGVVLITTPSKLSLEDFKRSKEFLEKFKLKEIAVVENMVGVWEPKLKGSIKIPFSPCIANASEEGKPIQECEEARNAIEELAEKVKEI